jgi:hypothetical protein
VTANVTGAGPGFGLHIVDVEVDKETGRTEIKRYTVVEDAGKAICQQGVMLSAAIARLSAHFSKVCPLVHDSAIWKPAYRRRNGRPKIVEK